MIKMFLSVIACSIILFSAIETRCVPGQEVAYPKPNKDEVTLDGEKHFEENQLVENRPDHLTENEGLEMRRKENEKFENLGMELTESDRLAPKRVARDGDFKNMENIVIKKEGFKRGDGQNGLKGIQGRKRDYALRDKEDQVDDKNAVGNEEFASKFAKGGGEFKTVEKRVVHNTGLKWEHALGHKETDNVESKGVQNQGLKTKGSIENEEPKNTQNSLLGNNDLELTSKVSDVESNSVGRSLIEMNYEAAGEEESKNKEDKPPENKVLVLNGVKRLVESDSMENGLIKYQGSRRKKATGNGKSKKKQLENKVVELKGQIKEERLGRMDRGLTEIKRLEAKKRKGDGKSENMENIVIQNTVLELRMEIIGGKSKSMERGLYDIQGLGPRKAKGDGDLKNRQLDDEVLKRKGAASDREAATTEEMLMGNEGLEPKSFADGNSDKIENAVMEIEGLKQESSFGEGESNEIEGLQRLEKRRLEPDGCFLEYLLCGPEHHDAHWKSEEHKRNYFKNMEETAAKVRSRGNSTIRTYSSQRRQAPKKKNSIWKVLTRLCRHSQEMDLRHD